MPKTHRFSLRDMGQTKKRTDGQTDCSIALCLPSTDDVGDIKRYQPGYRAMPNLA